MLATTNPGDMTETQRQTEADGLLQLAKTDTFKNIAIVKAKETTAVTVNGVEETPAARAQRFKDQYARTLVEQGVTEGKIFDKEKELELKKSEVAAKTITDTEAKAASAAADAKTNQIATDLDILNKLKIKAAAIHDRA